MNNCLVVIIDNGLIQTEVSLHGMLYMVERGYDRRGDGGRGDGTVLPIQPY